MHPLVSVTVCVKEPANRPLCAPVPEYEDVPPAHATCTTPLEPPLHDTCVLRVALHTSEVGCVTDTDTGEMQPFASVAVRLKGPADKPLNAPIPTYAAVPPVQATVTMPLEPPLHDTCRVAVALQTS